MSRYADLVMTDKPVGYWRLGEPAGAAFARDVLGKHDGVYSASNALAFGVAGALANDPDTAMTFDGNGRIVFGDAFDFGNDSAFSIELWLKTPLTNDSSYRRVISKESATEGYNLEVTPDGKLAFSVFAKGGPNVDGGIFDGVFVPVVAGTYVHVVAIYDTTAIQLYVNGALVETDPGVVTMPNRVDPFVIGGASFMTPLTDTRGTIDEVAVYDKILSPARILAHYLAGR